VDVAAHLVLLLLLGDGLTRGREGEADDGADEQRQGGHDRVVEGSVEVDRAGHDGNKAQGGKCAEGLGQDPGREDDGDGAEHLGGAND